MPTHLTKPQLRQQLITIRRSLPPETWQQKSQQICQQIRNAPPFQQAKTILSYCSHQQEPDLKDLTQTPGKTWGLPRCAPNRTLIWHQWQPQTQTLQPGSFGILEPSADNPIIPVDQIDLILVPCVAVDRQGYRLGYGGGYYDRLFADPTWQAIATIGVIFDFAILETLSIEPWDYPLQAVVTETQLIQITTYTNHRFPQC